MFRNIVLLILAGVLTLSAKMWVNAVRDPGAELGQGDWETDVWEWPVNLGVSDSAVISAHDSTRAFEGKFSFRTDTEIYPEVEGAQLDIWCYQNLKVKKAVKDLDSCEWVVYLNESGSDYLRRFYIAFKALDGKRALWYCGRTAEPADDTTYTAFFLVSDSGKWSLHGSNLRTTWVNMAKWADSDTITAIILLSQGRFDASWFGQDVSWDNIYLKSVAYYDYATKSIDSDSLAEKNYTPIVTFANEGIKADKDAWVYTEILEGSTRVYIDSQKVSIPKESNQQVTFANWTIPHTGSYTLLAYPVQELDELSSDDTLQQSLSATGIVEPVTPVTHTSLEVSALSSIRYSIPQGQQGTISLYEPSGRRIESLSVEGEGSVSLKAGLATGVYFVKLETRKASSTRKAVILR